MVELQILEKVQATPLLIAGVSRCPLLIHYGSDKFIPEKVFPVKNDSWAKPKKEGGLWTSPVDSKWGRKRLESINWIKLNPRFEGFNHPFPFGGWLTPSPLTTYYFRLLVTVCVWFRCDLTARTVHRYI